MLTIVKMKFGSHLYGLETENSDTDYKGIFLPSKEDCFLNKIPKSYSKSSGNNFSKNTKEDIDYEIYSLQYFLALAFQGETATLDMLHCPEDSNILMESSEIWRFIRKNRNKFYTKNLRAFLGYAMKQASKYGIKGSRINTCEEILSFFNKYKETNKLKEVWEEIPKLEHCSKDDDFIDICGKKIQKTVKINYAKRIIENYLNEYGERARLAKENKNIDFKAISHALRAGFQLKSLYEKGDIIFPFEGEEKKLLLNVKKGKINYLEEVAPILENLLDEVKALSKQSKYPEKVDKSFWEKFLIEIYNN